MVQRHMQEGLRLGARASGAFRETVRLRTSAWRSGVGERQVIGLNADVHICGHVGTTANA